MPERASATPTLMIENERIKVTEWKFAPGAETGHHRHQWDYIVVPMATGRLTITDSGGTSFADLASGRPYFRRAGVEHNVINDSPDPFAFIEIELK